MRRHLIIIKPWDNPVWKRTTQYGKKLADFVKESTRTSPVLKTKFIAHQSQIRRQL